MMGKRLLVLVMLLAVAPIYVYAQEKAADNSEQKTVEKAEEKSVETIPVASSDEKIFLHNAVSPITTLAKQAIVMDGQTGAILYEKNADALMPTSSMSKVLTIYLVLDAIKSGKLSLDQTVKISDVAWKQPGSRMFLNIGDDVKVEDLIRGVVIQSGNDAAVALAEAVAGSEASFANLMNNKAREFKMVHSHFTNAAGLPDPNHYSTARDLAILAQHLITDHASYYHYYSETDFTYNNIKQGNRNPLLYRNIGVDGVKTGHTEEAGYGLIASANRDNRRVIVVVNGLSSMQERADEPAKLIEWAYREYGFFSLMNVTDKVADAKIWLGNAPMVGLVAGKELNEVLPRSVKDKIQVVYEVNPETEAPVSKGQQLGKATITIPDVPAIEVPLVAMEDVKRMSFPKVLWTKFKRLLKKA